MKQLEQQIKAINKSLQSQNELMQKRTDELEAMLKELKAKNAELSQNLASLQKDYHEIVKSLTSTQSKDNTAAQQSQPQQPAQPTQIPQPRVSRVKDILAGNISGNTTKESMQDKELQEFAYKGTSLDYGLLNGEPVFNLNYIGKLLDINNPRTSINTSDEDYCIKLDNSIVGLTYNRKLHNTGELFITEAGLYKLLMRSDKPEAEIFQKWVTKEVLPSIRKRDKQPTTQIADSNIKSFENTQVETIDRDGAVFFKLTDIEKVLGLTAGQSAKWIKDEWFDSDEIFELRKTQLGGHSLKYVAESGLYRILNRTNSPKAKPFERWVTKEVLPSIRKSVRDSHTPSQTQITAQGDITSFSNHDLGNVRIAMRDKEPMFCLSDIAKVLEIQNSADLSNAIKREFDDGVDFIYPIIDSLGREQKATFISEPELYFVLMRSNSKKAKPFRQWVTKEVLPSIRKSGSYKIDSAQQREVFNLIYETPCRDAILKVVRDSEVQHNAKAKGIKEYTITEKMKRGKVYTNCQVGIEWDKYIPPTKPISKLRKAR